MHVLVGAGCGCATMDASFFAPGKGPATPKITITKGFPTAFNLPVLLRCFSRVTQKQQRVRVAPINASTREPKPTAREVVIGHVSMMSMFSDTVYLTICSLILMIAFHAHDAGHSTGGGVVTSALLTQSDPSPSSCLQVNCSRQRRDNVG